MKAMLVLEDGSSFEGISTGISGERVGEVVLNTAVVGYQEMITDPAYAGKILVLTYPLIGNYGVAKKFKESSKCWISGLVIKEPSRIYSNWQAEGSFTDFLKEEGVVAISDIDTRTVAVTIRDKGEMLGIISTKNSAKEDLLKKLKNYKDTQKRDFIKDISVDKITDIKSSRSGSDIAILDIGVTNSIIAQLKTSGCSIKLLPYRTSAGDIIKMRPDGLVISNGPENDAAMPAMAQTVKEILGKIPMLGISTGHEIIALAIGAKINKMKIGHHGVNYPIKPLNSFKGDITVQNHSYVVDADSLKSKKGVTVTAVNVNDSSVEAMESKALKFISVQYCPASPGFDEVNQIFGRFLGMAKAKIIRQKKCRTSCAEVQYAKA